MSYSGRRSQSLAPTVELAFQINCTGKEEEGVEAASSSFFYGPVGLDGSVVKEPPETTPIKSS